MSRARLVAVTGVLILVPSILFAQDRQHIIQGRVTSDSGAAIPAADVIVTIAPSAEIVTGKTDVAGNYRLVIANPTGEYILNISILGFRPFRQRVTMPPGDTVATVNAKLAVNIQQVAAVRVQAQRPRPQRSLENAAGIGTDANNKQIDGVVNALPPELRGNIEALAALVPGLAVTGNGVSAFGLGADANMTTLNGMPFSAGSVPRDLATTTNYITSTWDPRFGGFSGALASSTLQRGTNIETRRASASLDAPMLQASDPIAARAGQKFTNVLARRRELRPDLTRSILLQHGLPGVATDRRRLDAARPRSRCVAPRRNLAGFRVPTHADSRRPTRAAVVRRRR